MKKKILYIILLSIIVTGCGKDFLETDPKGKLIAEKTEDYSLILNSQNWISTHIEAFLGDDVCAIDKYFPTRYECKVLAFEYKCDLNPDPDVYPSYGDSSTSWTNLYNANKVINEVMDSKEGTEAEKKAVLAEARAFRAWEHIMLINRYAPHYDPATASTTPGFPIIDKADITVQYNEKVTVKEMYDFIIKELTESIPDLDPHIRHATRISKPAGEAILARVYWLMGRYSDALPLLERALQDFKIVIFYYS